MGFFKQTLRWRRIQPVLIAPVLYILVSVLYFHVPWKYRYSVYKNAPKIDRALMLSGYRILSVGDGFALFGHDVEIEIDDGYRGETVYGGYPSQGLQLFGRATILENRSYTAGYSESMNNPLWVAYRIFDVPELENGERASFRIDHRTRSKISTSDYKHSGFDRGHLAPNYGIGTRYGQEGQDETFLMSNIIPQSPGVNRGIWKDLEMVVAKQYGRYFQEVWVVTGPVFTDPIEKMESGIPIPSHYYKIIADENGGKLRVLAFLIESDCPPYTRIRKRLVSIDEIEGKTGLDFFPKLSEQAQYQLESKPATRLWPTHKSALKYHFKGQTQ